MEIHLKRKPMHLIARSSRKYGGGVIRIDEGACRAIEKLCETAGASVSLLQLASELIKTAAKETTVIVED